jgi:serine O-acetyltransferase
MTSSAGFRSIFFNRFLNYNFFKKNKKIMKLIYYLSLILTKTDVPYTAKIYGGLIFPHEKCIIIHPHCIIGKNVTIMQGATIGGNLGKKKNNRTSPKIGENVFIGPGAKILGPVEIGKNSIIGANTVITKDIPSNCIAVGVPAKVIKKIEYNYIEIEKQLIKENRI